MSKYVIIYDQGGEQPCRTKADIGHFIAALLENKPLGNYVSVSVRRRTVTRKVKK